MGVVAIPADCLMHDGTAPTPWHFANQIMNAVALVKQHPNLFLLCVSNFSCTIDAFTHSDARLGDGLETVPASSKSMRTPPMPESQTRLEAFLDIVRNYREVSANHGPPFIRRRVARVAR